MTKEKQDGEGCKVCYHRSNLNDFDYCHVINLKVDTENGWCNKFKERNIGKVTIENHAITLDDVHGHVCELPLIQAQPRPTTRYYLCPECFYSDVASAWNIATDEYYNGNIEYYNGNIRQIEESSVGYDHICPDCGESIRYEDIEILEG